MTARRVGSDTIAKSAEGKESTKAYMPRLACSSSAVIATMRFGRGPSSVRRFVAARIAASPAFMSQEPRPQIRPPSTLASKGGTVIPPTPTVSKCPFNRSVGPSPSSFAITLKRLGLISVIRVSSPHKSSHSATRFAASRSPLPPSSSCGFTEGVETKERVNASGSPCLASSSISGFKVC
jgi:hypothetical protein